MQYKRTRAGKQRALMTEIMKDPIAFAASKQKKNKRARELREERRMETSIARTMLTLKGNERNSKKEAGKDGESKSSRLNGGESVENGGGNS